MAPSRHTWQHEHWAASDSWHLAAKCAHSSSLCLLLWTIAMLINQTVHFFYFLGEREASAPIPHLQQSEQVRTTLASILMFYIFLYYILFLTFIFYIAVLYFTLKWLNWKNCGHSTTYWTKPHRMPSLLTSYCKIMLCSQIHKQSCK